MAFVRNYSNNTVSNGVLEEKRHGQSNGRSHRSVGNEDIVGTYSEREFDINMDAQYQSDGERNDAIRLHNEVAADNGTGVLNSKFQPVGRRIAPGKWVSTFWKDCPPVASQPLDQQGGSDSGQDLKSDRKNLEGSVYNSSDDRDDRLESEDDEVQRKAGKAQRGHSDVPADEILSDEYYEQDGEEQSDTMHYRGFSNVGLNTKPQSKPLSVSTTVSRSSRALNNRNYDDKDDDDKDDDADTDYEEEEEEYEDDPDDADFEPDYVVAGGHTGNK